MRADGMPPTAARDDLTCEEVIGFLYAYLAGEVDPERAAAFERHLAVCPSCLAYLATYRETIRLARGSLADADVAIAQLPRELYAAILAARAVAPADPNPAG